MSRTSAFPTPPAPKTVSSVHRIIVRQLHRFAFPLALLPALLLSRTTWAQTADTASADQKVNKVFYSAKDRLDTIHAAALFTPKAVADANILEGPAQNKKEFQLHFNDKVICDFDAPGSKMGGKTPKFSCKITRVESTDGSIQTLTSELDEEPVKVKFGADDNEVYAEVAATRLMWALGYYADAWFSVRVECHNCPENPISGSGSDRNADVRPGYHRAEVSRPQNVPKRERRTRLELEGTGYRQWPPHLRTRRTETTGRVRAAQPATSRRSSV